MCGRRLSKDVRICNIFQAYLDRMAQLNAVQSLVESHRCRLQLLQVGCFTFFYE